MHDSLQRARIWYSHGFTLIELLIAMAISGVVLLGGRLLFENLAVAARRTVAASAEDDRVANGDDLIRSLAGRLEVGTDQARRFAGDSRTVRFTAWCDTPAGWLERCNVLLGFEQLDSGAALVVHLDPVEPHGDVGPRVTIVARHFRSGELRYLNDPRAGGQWFVRWGEAITAPLAIAIIRDGDTGIVRIGGRE